MKYRSDFVTNSSSSSYIIAYQQTPDYDEETLKRYPALACFHRVIDMVLTASSSYNETDEGDKITTQEELEDFFVRRYSWTGRSLNDIFSEDMYLKEQYDKCLNAIQRGCIVLFKEVSYHDDAMTNLIEKLENGNVGVEIIDSDR